MRFCLFLRFFQETSQKSRRQRFFFFEALRGGVALEWRPCRMGKTETRQASIERVALIGRLGHQGRPWEQQKKLASWWGSWLGFRWVLEENSQKMLLGHINWFIMTDNDYVEFSVWLSIVVKLECISIMYGRWFLICCVGMFFQRYLERFGRHSTYSPLRWIGRHLWFLLAANAEQKVYQPQTPKVKSQSWKLFQHISSQATKYRNIYY